MTEKENKEEETPWEFATKKQLILGQWIAFAWDLLEMIRVEGTLLSRVYEECIGAVEVGLLTMMPEELPAAIELMDQTVERVAPVVTDFVNLTVAQEAKPFELAAPKPGLPPFTDIGYLPPGLYRATWEEFASRFGNTDERRPHLVRILKLLNLLKSGKATEVRIGGSYVTAKGIPGDVDIYWSGESDVNFDPILLGENDAAHLEACRILRKMIFGVDLHRLEQQNSLIENYTRFSARFWKRSSDRRGGRLLYFDCMGQGMEIFDKRLKELLAAMPSRRRIGAVVIALDESLPVADAFTLRDAYGVSDATNALLGLSHLSPNQITASPFLKNLVAALPNSK